jgi:Ca-activated chloride channel homolog
MSGLQVLAPLGIAALIGIPLIILFHMRHSTPIVRSVPSLRFWLATTPVRTDDNRFRLPPLSLLLILQLLAVTALGLALMRPAVSEALAGIGQRTEPAHVMMLVDGSTSMSATDTPEGLTRFEVARDEAMARIRSLRQGDAVTVMVLGTQSLTFQANDPAAFHALQARLGELEAPGGRTDFNAALRLARDLILPEIDNRIVVLSDGAISADPSLVETIDAPIEYIQIGRAATPNLAITELTTRTSSTNPARQQIYARAANFSDRQITVPLVVRADGLVAHEESLTIPPNDAVDIEVTELPEGASRITVTIEGADQLMADNEASIVVAQAERYARNFLLVSDIPNYVQRALAALPGAQITTVSTTEFLNGQALPGSYDLVVYDNVTPSGAPGLAAPALVINPPRDGPLATEGVMTTPVIERIRGNDPILADVDLTGVTFSETPVHLLDATHTEIVGADAGPLIYRGVLPDSGQAMVVLTFDLNRSNLPLRVSFPILVANIVGELAPNPMPSSVPLGDPLRYEPGADVSHVEIMSPSGNRAEITVSHQVEEGEAAATGSVGVLPMREIVFAATGQPGEYVVTEISSSGRAQEAGIFMVNAGHEQESDLRSNLEVQATLAHTNLESVGGGSTTLSDLWPLLAAIGLILIVIEWFVASGGFRRRRASSQIGRAGLS